MSRCCGAQAFAQRVRGIVAAAFRPDDAEDFDARAERGEIGGDVAGAAEAFALLDEIDDGDGGFGREARGGAPEVAVEHQVAEDADAFALRRRGTRRLRRATAGRIAVDVVG